MTIRPPVLAIILAFSARANVLDLQRLLHASTYDTGIYLFRRSSDTPLWIYDTLQYAPERVDYTAISADGRYVVAGGFGGWVYLLRVVDLASLNAEPLPYSVVAGLVIVIGITAAAAFTVTNHIRVKKSALNRE